MRKKQKDWSLKDRLIGEELNAVQFVMDYLQVFFNDKWFNFYVWPSVDINNEIYTFEDIDYKNKLCEFIGKRVKDVYFFDNDILVIEFEKSDRILLNLDSNNPEIYSEIAIFWDKDNQWAVFE